MLPDYLTAFPIDYTDPRATELKQVLALGHGRTKSIQAILGKIGIPAYLINWEQSVIDVWHDVLEEARNKEKIEALLNTSVADDEGLEERVNELLSADGPVAATHGEDGEPDWKGFADSEGIERLIVEYSNTLLDIAFLAYGLERAKSVGRLRVKFDRWFYGTGFRISDDLILTNHHVLYDWKHGDQPASEAEIWFDYERDLSGAMIEHKSVGGDVTTIDGNRDNDWAVIRVAGIPPGYPILSLKNTRAVEKDDRVYIIQHPEGSPKQIGMHHNLVRHTDDNVIQYWTDTLEGSSGSPVFNDLWEVVGLHHRWVKVKHDGKDEYRNQARRIESVVEELQAKGLI